MSTESDMAAKAALARANVKARKDAGLPGYKDPIEKHVEDPHSLRKAVNAKCYDCMGRDSDPGVIDRIRTCDVVKCTLNSVRPYQ